MVLVALTKEEVSQRAMQFMTTKDYRVISQTDTAITFEDGKDLDMALLILGVIFLLIGAIIYYLMSKRHTITITLSEEAEGVKVICYTNTTKALKDSQDFIRSLQEP